MNQLFSFIFHNSFVLPIIMWWQLSHYRYELLIKNQGTMVGILSKTCNHHLFSWTLNDYKQIKMVPYVPLHVKEPGHATGPDIKITGPYHFSERQESHGSGAKTSSGQSTVTICHVAGEQQQQHQTTTTTTITHMHTCTHTALYNHPWRLYKKK